MRLYNKIENNNRLEYGRTRKDVGVGENSPDSTMNAKNYFLVVDSGMPSYNVDTHKYTGTSFTFDGTTDTKVYNIVALTQQEIDDLLEVNRDSGKDSLDVSCKAYIYSYWSAEAQSNAALGLIPQDDCELCKTEISAVLVENITFIDHIDTLTTKAEIDTYVSGIVRVVITGGV